MFMDDLTANFLCSPRPLIPCNPAFVRLAVSPAGHALSLGP
jgi:hypothetical protein